MQTEKSQPMSEWIMSKTKFTEYRALSVDPRVGISWSASKTNVRLFFLPMTLKIIIHYSSLIYFSHFKSHNDLFRMSFCFVVVHK